MQTSFYYLLSPNDNLFFKFAISTFKNVIKKLQLRGSTKVKTRLERPDKAKPAGQRQKAVSSFQTP